MLLGACGGSTPVDPPVATSVTVAPAVAEFTSLGESRSLSATVRDQNGNVMAGASVSWTSTEPGVAGVDASGRVTSVGEGSALIRATSGGASDEASVSVTQVPAELIVPSQVTLVEGGTDTTLVASVVDALGAEVADAVISWSSDDTGVATVVDGLVSAVGDGSATITVEATHASTTVSAEVTVTVNASLMVVTDALDNGVPGLAYESEALEALGGGGGYSWALAPGSDPLPPGFSLSASGVVSGMPTDTLRTSFTAQVASDDGQTATGIVTLAITPQVVVAPDASCVDYSKYSRVTFEDPALSSYVIDFLGLSGAEQLTCEYAASVLALRPSQTGISSLAGIQNFPSLSTLEFFNNFVVDLTPVAGLSELVRLDARENLIADVTALSGLTELRVLWLVDNPVSDISSLTGLTGLVNLELSRTQIDDADLAALGGMSQLEVLSLDELALTDPGVVAGMPLLRELSLRDNQIASVSALAGLTMLQYLNLGSNLIADASPLGGLTSLSFLSLSDNALTDIAALASLTTLDQLYLSWNPLNDLAPLSGLTGLETLLIDEVGVSDLTALAGLTNLRSLQARTNGITDVSSLSGLSSLETLRLDNNALVSLSGLGALTSLTYLFAASNVLTDVSALGSLTAITYVTLEANAGLSDVDPLIANPALGSGDTINLLGTNVGCTDVASLEAKGVTVQSAC